MDYLERAKQLEEYSIAIRRTLHKQPELGLDTPKSKAFLKEELKKIGLNPAECGTNGLTATIGNADGPVLLMRADFDALPMQEESGLSFASQVPGYAHCCGHDLHAAMLVTAARMLKENEANLKGCVKLMLQPGEETMDGCADMIKGGILNAPAPKAALGMHVDAVEPLGHIGWGKGPTFCSNDMFSITVTGKSCHGARPHQGIDAIGCSAHIITALEALIAREADPSETDILTICSIESDTKVFNIFPQSVVLKGSLRTYSAAQREFLRCRLEEIVRGISLSFGCSCNIDYQSSMNTAEFNVEMQLWANENLKKNLGENIDLANEPLRKMGSDDLAGITAQLPTAYFFLGAGPSREEGWFCSQHNTKVVFNEKCMPIGAAALAITAEAWLKKESDESQKKI